MKKLIFIVTHLFSACSSTSTPVQQLSLAQLQQENVRLKNAIEVRRLEHTNEQLRQDLEFQKGKHSIISVLVISAFGAAAFVLALL